ncbi:prepilin-type N-terminal cleavage/methylation domain-containing protein [Paraneptunicella aestuarii]|uniref:prepilin-type N-terminal cleavage/methylation domain-containing protein n=1 Tax=Paraneptunicella aestuarii TaxID=2831148 RepID=UPI001E5C9428|nr:prepilin-type N-terminal cleavage/methylation domain-containing protein [Paraneptunicella aestuarii]UAA39093.1 prepilin-type N-terminal cleavage/methylation domain-containing protein [Paraneptunicella aestuarii]
MQRGFSLIELVIVVVVLGLLAATALPRFLDVTDDAEDATVEGVAGGFATGVGLIRAQWEIEGRPKENQGANVTFVTLDGIQIGVDKDTGYPTGQASTNTEDVDISNLDCESIFNLIIQSAPTITSTWDSGAEPFQNFRYFTKTNSGAGAAGNDVCFYYLTQTVKNETAEPNDNGVGNGFIYDPRIGQVTVFSNN